MWWGEAPRVRLLCGGLNMFTALTFVQVLRRLFVPGISVEDTMTWWGAWSIVLDGRGRTVYQPAAQLVAQRRTGMAHNNVANQPSLPMPLSDHS